MANIGERATLKILRQNTHGVFLDAGNLGEVLLPRREAPSQWQAGDSLDVFLYTDSEDRPVATLVKPKAMPGSFARLQCIATTSTGAFLDWGLAKDLLVPFGEQKSRMEEGKYYICRILVDEKSGRILASTRLTRYLDKAPHFFQPGEEVDLLVFAKTDLGYKAIVNHNHSGLIYAKDVFQPLQPGESLKGYIADVRPDGKIDLTLHAPGRAKVDALETRVLAELKARGGFWNLGDHSPAEEIHDELGASKRAFKQAIGALLKRRIITVEPNGIRLL